MAYMRHHAIIVTSWDGDGLKKAHEKAKEIFPKVTEIIASRVNGYETFFVPPDGSKEGWEDSDHGDYERDNFLDWLSWRRDYLCYSEIQYYDEGGDERILRSSKRPEDAHEGR